MKTTCRSVKTSADFFSAETFADIGMGTFVGVVTGLIWTTLPLNEHVVPGGGQCLESLKNSSSSTFKLFSIKTFQDSPPAEPFIPSVKTDVGPN